MKHPGLLHLGGLTEVTQGRRARRSEIPHHSRNHLGFKCKRQPSRGAGYTLGGLENVRDPVWAQHPLLCRAEATWTTSR